MKNQKLFESYKLGSIELKNRIVMSPMTRCRAIDNIPNELIAEYYGQRASAGLIITEGTSPSPNGLGYCRIPGIFNDEQIAGWKLVADKVHAKGGKIFVQLMHTGRIANEVNLPDGAVAMAPSAIKAAGQIWTDKLGMQDHSMPKEMTLAEIESTKQEFVQAAKNAIAAGLDGVELHGANGYLLEQFISPHSNQRTDNYGGSIENRTRIILDIAKEAAEAIGADKVGIRLSPYGVASDMQPYPEIEETYTYLAEKLNEIGIAYIHVVDHSSMGAPEVPARIKAIIRENFRRTAILAGGYDKTNAENDLQAGRADLIGFGRPFIGNPDLVTRLKHDFALNMELDTTTFYSADAKGYTDYPVSKEALESAFC